MFLFVEDEAISRYALAQILRSRGHEVMEAKDGIEALALLDEHTFDLIITDLIMPLRTRFSNLGEMARNVHGPIRPSGHGGIGGISS